MKSATLPIADLNGTAYSRLDRQAVVRLQAPGRLRVLRGRAWVTISGQPRDWFLVAGRTMELREFQQLVVQADPQCVIGWRTSGQWPARSPRWVQRLKQVAKRLWVLCVPGRSLVNS